MLLKCKFGGRHKVFYFISILDQPYILKVLAGILKELKINFKNNRANCPQIVVLWLILFMR